MVLVIVLWIALGLVAVVLLFADGMRMEYKASANAAAGLQAGQGIEGARRYLTFVLTNAETPGVMPELDTYKADAVPLDDLSFWLIGRADSDVSSKDTPTFGFVDEASKLNLNKASREMLEGLPEMTPELAAAIVDWRDENSDPEPDGAESEAYLLNKPAYDCKNAPFESVEELRLVKGATWDLLYGEDTNLNGVLDPNENDGKLSLPDDDSDGKLKRGILDFVTIYSRESNKKADGSDRIDVRRPPRDGLNDLLVTSFGDSRAGQITAAIGAAQFASLLEFYAAAALTPEEAAKIDNSLKADDGDFTEGKINVNTAPREVLLCVTGIGEKFADALIAARQGKTTEQLGSVAWANEVLDETARVSAGPLITSRSYRLSADIVAVASRGRALRRAWMVFDTSATDPIVVFRSDRTGLGWPLGLSLRQTLDGREESRKKTI